MKIPVAVEGSSHALHVAALVVETDDPVEAVLRCARECGCELVVMGTRGRGALQGIALGSAASRVAQRSDLAVTLVR